VGFVVGYKGPLGKGRCDYAANPKSPIVGSQIQIYRKGDLSHAASPAGQGTLL